MTLSLVVFSHKPRRSLVERLELLEELFLIARDLVCYRGIVKLAPARIRKSHAEVNCLNGLKIEGLHVTL
jgi:hypothetical protein